MRIQHRDPASERVTDQRVPCETARLDHGPQIAIQILELIAVLPSPSAVAVSALVHRDDVESVVEAAAEIVPHMRVKTAAVDEDDRMPAMIAPVEVVQSNAVAIYELAARKSRYHAISVSVNAAAHSRALASRNRAVIRRRATLAQATVAARAARREAYSNVRARRIPRGRDT